MEPPLIVSTLFDREYRHDSARRPYVIALELAGNNQAFFNALTPLTIFSIGLMVTAANEKARLDQQEKANNAAYERAVVEKNESKDRDIAKTVIERLQRDDACARPTHLRALIAMATPDRAQSLQALFSEQCSLPQTETTNTYEVARTNEISGILTDLRGSARRAAENGSEPCLKPTRHLSDR